MKALRIGLIAVLLVPVMAGAVAATNIGSAKAEGTFGGSNLGNLIVLNGLFNGGNTAGLAGLIAVNNATGGTIGSTAGGSNLSDLIVLNGLFNGGGFGGFGFGGNLAGLAGLIAVSNATGRGF